MDTKTQEHIAENMISSKLLAAGILVAKPLFDEQGGDLLGLNSGTEKAQLCRIQCKYRDCTKKTNITLPSAYVAGAFVLFIYLKQHTEYHLLCFLPSDFGRYFKERQDGEKKVLRLSITVSSAKRLILDPVLAFSKSKVEDIKALMQASSPISEFHRAFLKIVQTHKNLQQVRERTDSLKGLLHKYEIATLKKQAIEEQVKILQDYLSVVELQMEKTNRNSTHAPMEGTQKQNETEDQSAEEPNARPTPQRMRGARSPRRRQVNAERRSGS